VLLVEDEAPLRHVIARNLTSRGVQVCEAATAAEAIQASNTEVLDLLLLDINLPDRTGWDVLRDLNQRHVEVPTIVVSAVRVSQSRLDGPPAGVLAQVVSDRSIASARPGTPGDASPA